MSKPFSIHDWQAKQRLLKEQKQLGLELTDEEKDLVDDVMDNLSKRINPTRDIEKSTALFKYIDGYFEVQGGTYEENVAEHHAGDYNPGFLKQSVNTFLDKLKKKTKEGKDYETVEKIMEKHFSAKKKNENVTEALNPEVSQKVNAFIKAMAKRYDYSEQDAVFAIMAALKQRKTDEASTTGTGASFTPGTGAAYATPRAFGDNKRKKKKGYMGYKEI